MNDNKKGGFLQSIQNMIEKIRAAITKFRFWIRKKLYKPNTFVCVPRLIWSKCESLLKSSIIVAKTTDDDVKHAQEVLTEVRSGNRFGGKDDALATLQMQPILKLLSGLEKSISKIEAFAKYNNDEDLSPELFAKAIRCANIRIQILQTLVVRYISISNRSLQKIKREAEDRELNESHKTTSQDGKAASESFTCESFIDFCDDLQSPAEEGIFGNLFNKKRGSDEEDEKMTLKVIDESMDAIKDYAKRTLDRKYKHSIYSYKKEFRVALYMDGVNMGIDYSQSQYGNNIGRMNEWEESHPGKTAEDDPAFDAGWYEEIERRGEQIVTSAFNSIPGHENYSLQVKSLTDAPIIFVRVTSK